MGVVFFRFWDDFDEIFVMVCGLVLSVLLGWWYIGWLDVFCCGLVV